MRNSILFLLLLCAVCFAGPFSSITDKVMSGYGAVAGGVVSVSLIFFLVMNGRKLVNSVSALLANVKAFAKKVQAGESVSKEEVEQIIDDLDNVLETVANFAARFGAKKAAKRLRDIIK